MNKLNLSIVILLINHLCFECNSKGKYFIVYSSFGKCNCVVKIVIKTTPLKITWNDKDTSLGVRYLNVVQSLIYNEYVVFKNLRINKCHGKVPKVVKGC